MQKLKPNINALAQSRERPTTNAAQNCFHWGIIDVFCICANTLFEAWLLFLHVSCSPDQTTNSETMNPNSFYNYKCLICLFFISLTKTIGSVEKLVKVQSSYFRNWLLDPVSKIMIKKRSTNQLDFFFCQNPSLS